MLLILIYFASLRYEQAVPSQHARLLFTPSLHRGTTTGTWSAARVVLRIRRVDRRSMTAVLQQSTGCRSSIALNTNYSSLCFAAFMTGRRLTSPRSSRRTFRAAPYDLPIATYSPFRATISSITAAVHSLALGQLYGTLYLRLTGCMDTYKARLKAHYFKFAFNVYLYIPLISQYLLLTLFKIFYYYTSLLL